MYILRSMAVLMTDEQIVEALTDGMIAKVAAVAAQDWPQVSLLGEFNQILEDEFNGRVSLESGRDVGQALSRMMRGGKLA